MRQKHRASRRRRNQYSNSNGVRITRQKQSPIRHSYNSRWLTLSMFLRHRRKYLWRRCWCGTSGVKVNKYGAIPEARCNKPCAGDSSKKCGGHNTFQAFKFDMPEPPSGYIGCFKDQKCDRIFSSPKKVFEKANTPQVRDERFCSKLQAAPSGQFFFNSLCETFGKIRVIE